MTNSNNGGDKKDRSWMANVGGFASGAALGYHIGKDFGEAKTGKHGDEKSGQGNQHAQTAGTVTGQQAFHTAAGEPPRDVHYMGAESQQGGPANEGEDRIYDGIDPIVSLDVGTEGPNGGPNRDPDLALGHHSGVDRMGTESPRGGPSDDPDRVFDSAQLTDSSGEPSPYNPTSGGTTDPDFVTGHGIHLANLDVGPTAPNGGPSNDPSLTP